MKFLPFLFVFSFYFFVLICFFWLFNLIYCSVLYFLGLVKVDIWGIKNMSSDGFQMGEYAPLKYNDVDRLGFIRKVYGILTAQLSFTFLLVLISAFSDGYRSFMRANTWLFILFFIGSFTCLIYLVCCKKYARTVPQNYILLGLFTLFEALAVSGICAFYDPIIIVVAMAMTVGLTSALTAYACITKTDFTTKIGGMIIFLLAGICLAIFLPIFYHGRVVQVIICVIFIIIYGFYLLIDTQLICGGGRYELSYDDYILGALYLFVDIIGLFLYLLRLLGASRG